VVDLITEVGLDDLQTSETDLERSVKDFSEQLSHEILTSLRLRAAITAGAFGLGTAILTVGSVYFILFL
jgi:hypothetical protein